jgi:DNA polymerase I-like protein with 3'-5' exonuclease and polymerase domains
MRIVLDIEKNLAHDKIHLVVTKDIDTGEVRKWKVASNLPECLKGASLIVMHNGISFDAPVLNRLWKTKIRLNQVYDTLIVSRLLDPSRENGHSLEAWGTSLGINKLNYKATWEWMMDRREEYKGECFDNPIDSLLSYYCVRDVEVTAKLYLKLVNEIENFYEDYSYILFPKLKGVKNKECLELEHRVASIIAQQERNGFKLDIPYATVLLTTIKSRLAEIYEGMQQRWPSYIVERYSDKTGKRLKDSVVTFNPGSRQQIGEKLIELGWKPRDFTPTGQPIVDESVLSKSTIPEAKMIAEYLMLQKRIAQIESWLEAVGKDGRVHGKVITNGAVTGRMTHSTPNMAQIPNSGSIYGPECRECWSVEDGNVLVGCDASGLELRMFAHYMKDDDYVKTVCEGSSKDGSDVHTKNQKAAGLHTRDQAKTFIYAFLYGAGPAKIGSIVGGGSKEGSKLIAAFLKGTPSLQGLRDKVSKYASKGYVPGLDGRKIWVRSEHAALNSLLQGAGAIVMKKALVIFDDKRIKNKWDVKYVANVHDEAQLETTKELAEVVGEAFKQSIIEAGEHFKLRCPLDGEYKVGNNWRETH